MDLGYSSDPTSSTTSSLAAAGGGRGGAASSSSPYRRQQQPHHHHQQSGPQLHHDFSNLSLHGRQHLQSTPNSKSNNRSTLVGHAGSTNGSPTVLHRVRRNGAPPLLLSGTESSLDTTASSQDLDEDEGGSEEEHQLEHAGATNLRKPVPIRDYWNQLRLDVDVTGRDPHGDMVASSSGRQRYNLSVDRVAQAPSTGSSTLVDQESLLGGPPPFHAKSGQSPQGRTVDHAQDGERSASAPPADQSTSTGTARGSPSQSHLSRFMGIVEAEDDLLQQQLSLAGTDSRFKASSRTHTLSSSTSSVPPVHNISSNQSDVVARVHDIFARHIHNAATNPRASRNASNVSSSTTTLAQSQPRSNVSTARPKQRLRDLLAASSNTSGNASSQQRLRNTYQEHSFSPSRRQRFTSPSQTPSAHHRDQTSSPSRMRASPARQTQNDRQSPRSAGREHHQDLHSHAGLSSIQDPSELREIDAIRHRHLSSRRRQESDDEMDGGSDMESAAENKHHSIYDNVRDDRQRGETDGEDEETDFSPADMESDQDEDEAQDPPLHSRSPTDETFPSSTEEEVEILRAERRASPGSASLRPFPAAMRAMQTNPQTRLTPPTTQDTRRLDASPSISRNTRQTPPKTPHPPGYLATPYLDSRSLQNAKQGLSPDQTFAHAGQTTLDRTHLLPLPGGYSSPFPHPKRSNRSVSAPSSQSVVGHHLPPTGIAEVPTDGRPTLVSPSKRKGPSKRSPSATPRAHRDRISAELSTSMSPSKRRGLSKDEAPRAQNVAKVESTAETVGMQSTEADTSIATLDITDPEGTVHSLLGELVKPLRSLLGGFTHSAREVQIVETRPDSLETPSATSEAYENLLQERTRHRVSLSAYDDSVFTFAAHHTFRTLLSQSEQDSILAKLSEADRLDRSLGQRIEEIRSAVDEMGSRLSSQVSGAHRNTDNPHACVSSLDGVKSSPVSSSSDQVTTVLTDSFAQESRRRRTWLLLAILSELALLWLIFSFANARANLLYRTTYYDPFFPELYGQGGAAQDAFALLPIIHRYENEFLYDTSAHAATTTTTTVNNGPINNMLALLNIRIPFRLSPFPSSSWHRLYTKRIVDNLVSLTLGSEAGARTGFVHGTHGAAAVTALGSSVTTAVHRIPS